MVNHFISTIPERLQSNIKTSRIVNVSQFKHRLSIWNIPVKEMKSRLDIFSFDINYYYSNYVCTTKENLIIVYSLSFKINNFIFMYVYQNSIESIKRYWIYFETAVSLFLFFSFYDFLKWNPICTLQLVVFLDRTQWKSA